MVPVAVLLTWLSAVLAESPGAGADERLSLLDKLLAWSVVALALLVVAMLLVRWIFKKVRAKPTLEPQSGTGRTADDSAFAVAAFQGVIQRLREQEKELERLHLAERQRAQQSAQLTAAILHNLATGVLMVNAQELITGSNPAAKEVLGHQLLEGRSFREVLGQTRELSHATPALAEMLETCLHTGQGFHRITVPYRAPTGENKVLGVGMAPIQQESREGGVICLLSDLTEMAALQQQVRLKESLAALGEMSAGIAHEFKNSLATISGYGQLIRQEESLETARQHAARLVGETQFLTHVVNDFLNFSRPLNLVACDVSTRDLIERSFQEITGQGEFLEVTLELAGEFPTVTADQTLLRQCFANLLRNGCEATAQGGRPGRIVVDGQLEQTESSPILRLRFTDNGPGIPSENLDKVFIPFFTTKNEGTGLGLALVHKIVVNHNGKIQVASPAGGGTTFTVTLPLVATGAPAPSGTGSGT